MYKTERQLQKEDTHKRIVETAYSLFAEKGFSATTSDIAKKAGVSHGTIFAHFPTLNDLLICLLSEFGESIGLKLHCLAENNGSIKETLKAHLDVLEKYEDFYTRFIIEINMLPEEARNTFVMIQSTVAFHFAKALEAEKNNIKDLPPHMLFNTWIGLIHYYLFNRDLFAPEGNVIKRYGDTLIRSFISLIQTERLKEDGGND